jgi:hypothetical protein
VTKGYVLLKCSDEEGLFKLKKILQKILPDCVEYRMCSQDKVLLTLKDAAKDLSILKASFPALLVDNESLSNALVLPCDSPMFYSYLDFVPEQEFLELFKVAKKHPEVYDETYDLIGSFDNETLRTIQVYIENNCSPLLSSFALFVHKNTVTYRVNCFVRKTGIHLDSFANQMFLYELISSRDESKAEMI